MMTVQCSNKAVWRYTWPGNNEMVCCEEHKQQILGVAEALGFHLQMQPVIEEGQQCQNKIKERL
jgi:hypothetical protein